MKHKDSSNYSSVKKLIIQDIINIEDLSEKELNVLIDLETEEIINSKTEADLSFLNMCHDAMHKFKDHKKDISAEKCIELGEKSYNEFISRNITESKHTKRIPFAKRAAIFCTTILMVCFMTLSATAISLGSYSAAWDLISKNVSEIIKFTGSKDIGNITIDKNGVSEKYYSVEEFLYEERLDILYPGDLPGGADIRKIHVKTDGIDTKIMFGISNSTISFTVQNKYSFDFPKLDCISVYRSGDVDFYIIEVNGTSFQAMAHYGGMEYTINSESYDELIFIIDNLKKH